MKKSIIACLLVSAVLLSQGLFADDWRGTKLHKEADLTLLNEAISSLQVDVGAGDLRIVGNSNQQDIKVSAKVYGKGIDENDYALSLSKEGDQAVLIAQFKGSNHNNVRIDLEVTMPASLRLVVNDRSGDVSIESVSNGLTLSDRSGDIQLSDIAGPVKIEDRSGDLIAKDVRGNVTIADRSGEIQLMDVAGDVNIDDSSGDIRVKNASGKVTVADSSGDININGAAEFELESDSSGDVDLRNIDSNIKLI